MSAWNDVKERIREHEGFKPLRYKDSLGHSTIGYGHKIQEGETFGRLSQEEALVLFEKDFRAARIRAMRFCTTKERRPAGKKYELSPLRLGIVIEMSFQLGSLAKWQKFRTAVALGDWEWAALEMLDSLWMRQTPKRASKLASMMFLNRDRFADIRR